VIIDVQTLDFGKKYKTSIPVRKKSQKNRVFYMETQHIEVDKFPQDAVDRHMNETQNVPEVLLQGIVSGPEQESTVSLHAWVFQE